MKTILLFFLLFSAAFYECRAEKFDIVSCKNKITCLVKNEISINLSFKNAQPTGRITALMKQIDKICQCIMQQKQNNITIAESERCLALLSALRHRREYAYSLWAEYLIEGATSGKYEDLTQLDQNTLMRLYDRLGDINIALIKENMLSREIISRMSEIYDHLEKKNKILIRRRSILKQRDPLSMNDSIPIRKSLDDF